MPLVRLAVLGTCWWSTCAEIHRSPPVIRVYFVLTCESVLGLPVGRHPSSAAAVLCLSGLDRCAARPGLCFFFGKVRSTGKQLFAHFPLLVEFKYVPSIVLRFSIWMWSKKYNVHLNIYYRPLEINEAINCSLADGSRVKALFCAAVY